MKLTLQGASCSRHRVAKLMRTHGIVAKTQKRFKVKSKVNAGAILAENRLEQNFKVEAPDQMWVSDISQIKTLEGWLYLAVILDLFSRKDQERSEEHTSELQSLMRISYAVFCLQKNTKTSTKTFTHIRHSYQVQQPEDRQHQSN